MSCSFIGRKEWKSKLPVNFQQNSCLQVVQITLKNVGSCRLEPTFEPTQGSSKTAQYLNCHMDNI